MDTVKYFGYGANRDPEMIKMITGKSGLKGEPAVLKGFKLCVQRLDQVPDTIFPTSPVQKSPKALLLESWDDSFTTYIIKPDPEGEVAGIVYKLTQKERELIQDWEMVDYGWYQDIKTKVQTADGQIIEVETEGLREGQEVDHEVNGKDYEAWLNPPKKFAQVAEKSRREYFERMGQTKEGTSIKEKE